MKTNLRVIVQSVQTTEKAIEKKANVLKKKGNHVTAEETLGGEMINRTEFLHHHLTDSVTMNEVMTKKEEHLMYEDTMKERERGMNFTRYHEF